MRRFLSILTLLASLSFGEDVAVLQTFDEPYVLNGSSFAQPDEFTKAPYEDGDYVRFVWASSSSTVDGTIVGVIGGGEYALLTVLGGFVTPTDGLLQWLDGQNDGDTTLSDRTTPAYDVEMVQSSCLSFDGLDDYVDFGNESSVHASGQMTVIVLGKCNSFSTQNMVSDFDFLGGGNSKGYAIGPLAGNLMRFRVRDTTISAPTDTGWHWFVGVKDLTHARLYIDGVEVASAPVGDVIQQTTYSLKIARAAEVVSEHFDGNIACVKIMNRAITPDEASSMEYGSFVGGVLQSFLSESSGSIAYDTSGTGNHGTINGATWALQDICHANMVNGFAAYTNGVDTVRVPALADGSGYATNAVSGYALEGEYPPIGKGVMHNNAETLLVQTDFSVLSSIEVSGLTGVDAVDNGVYEFVDTLNDRPRYYFGTRTLSQGGGRWTLNGDSYLGFKNSTTTLPEKTGYTVGPGGTAPTISYSLEPWLTSNEWNQVSYADGKAHVSGNDNVWVNFETSDGVCLWTDSLIYSGVLSLVDYTAVSNLYPNACGAGIIEPLYDVGGSVLYDDDGEVIYVQP